MLGDYLKSFNTKKLTLIGPLIKERAFFSPPVVYIDGGTHLGVVENSFSIGDGDSSSVALDLQLPREKDESDLAYALKNIPEQYNEISLLGFLGGRKDHELINLAEIHRFLSERSETRVHFDDEICAFSGSLELNIKGIFSLFAFEESKVSVKGACKYPLESQLLARSSHGLSNEGSGVVIFETNCPIFLFRVDKQED